MRVLLMRIMRAQVDFSTHLHKLYILHIRYTKPSLLFTECGPNFTSKLEGMFKDMELSKELMATWTQVSYCGREGENDEGCESHYSCL